MLILSILVHHSEPGDPILLEWIKHQIDAITGLGPLTIVIGLGAVVVLIPVIILGLFLFQRAKYSRI